MKWFANSRAGSLPIVGTNPEVILRRHQRQVHLDFHTSPHISDLGQGFDAAAFTTKMRRAHVNSVTVFAKCHHGMCSYPTTTGVGHSALGGSDLLGEQMDALHRAGTRAPIYTTIIWEEDVAQRFPQWRQLTKEGHFAGWGNYQARRAAQPRGDLLLTLLRYIPVRKAMEINVIDECGSFAGEDLQLSETVALVRVFSSAEARCRTAYRWGRHHPALWLRRHPGKSAASRRDKSAP